MTTSVLHALATGLPVIATDHGAFFEQVHDGENGFLVPGGDYKTLAEKILFMMDHPELWPSFGRAGSEIVRKSFHLPELIAKQVEIYEELI